MSVTKTRTCDRCGENIPGEPYEHITVYVPNMQELDLCYLCMKEFRAFLDGATHRAAGLCIARTRYNEQCQRPAGHSDKHVYTSPADGASVSWEDSRER